MSPIFHGYVCVPEGMEFPEMGPPIAGWFPSAKPTKVDDTWDTPFFRKPPYSTFNPICNMCMCIYIYYIICIYYTYVYAIHMSIIHVYIIYYTSIFISIRHT